MAALTSSHDHDSSDTAALRPGDVLCERYHLEKKLGSGAFGQVFAAKDLEQPRRVAIKILRASAQSRDPDALARLRQEADILDAIEHPNIVEIYAVEDSPQGCFMVMELLEGKSIDQLLVADGPAAPDRVAQTAHQLLSALIASHARGVLHRDLKPENIILVEDPESDGEQAKLLDFGIAKAQEILDESDEDGVTLVHTRGGGFMGTPRYCAPEIVVGDPADATADIFSLGLVLAEWLTDKERINARKQNRALAILLQPEPLDVADCPPRWQPWLAKMIEKNPAHRYASAELALTEFERLVLQNKTEDQPADPDYLSDTADTCVREVPDFSDYQLPESERAESERAESEQTESERAESERAESDQTQSEPKKTEPPTSEQTQLESPASPSEDRRLTSSPPKRSRAPESHAPRSRSASIAHFLIIALGSCTLILLLVFLWQNFSA